MTVLPFPAPPQKPKQSHRPNRQARCLVEGLSFACGRGIPLNTHLIVHWGGTMAVDDPDGKLFAKLRYLLDKRFRRKFGIELTGI